jgi:phage terminase small subunit
MLTVKQERFTLNLFRGMTQDEAYIAAGYAPNKPSIIEPNACKLAGNSKIVARLDQLRAEAKTAAIMDVQERQERLSEIARARLTDFVEAGPDGARVNIGIGGCQSAALEEVTSHTEYDDNGDKPTVITKIKLHDPIRAIAELNKMGGDYAPEKKQIDLNVDVRFVIGKGYQVIDSTARELTDGNSHP